jgi:carbon monoxide dehydrogenase subunit G
MDHLYIERSERMLAPIPFVWEEVSSLDRVLAQSVHVTNYEATVNGDRARGSTMHSRGPVKKTLILEATLLGVVEERQIRYAIEGCSVGTRFEANIDLIPLGATETKLNCQGALEVGHRLASHLSHVLDDMTEEYVTVLIDRVKAHSEQRRPA